MIQDFQLNPSFNIYFDSMEYHSFLQRTYNDKIQKTNK